MCTAIISFAYVLRQLFVFIEANYVKAGYRKTLAICGIVLASLGRSSKQTDAFRWAKIPLNHKFTLAHKDCNCCLSFYADPWSFVCSGAVLRDSFHDLYKTHISQRHLHLCFLSGQIFGPSLGR